MSYAFLSACHTSTGVNKPRNQDAVLLKQAKTFRGMAAFAVICDGLGGLESGEIASAAAVRSFSDWFQYVYPDLVSDENPSELIRDSWYQLIALLNRNVQEYGQRNHMELGTTVEALLLSDNHYYILHIGDCRVYSMGECLIQLTSDQTFVQQQIDRGLMSPKEACRDERRSAILQCVGVSRYLQPDFLQGDIKDNQSFLICSDGFRHMQNSGEIKDSMQLPLKLSERYMEKQLIRMTERCRRRGEEDDISSIWILAENAAPRTVEIDAADSGIRHFVMTKDLMLIHTDEKITGGS